MKVVAFNGSARKGGNTSALIKMVFKVLEEKGISTELIDLAGTNIRGCTACYRCLENKDKKCAVTGDKVNECIDKMIESDGIILASPSYFSTVSTELKALIDRSGMVAKVNGDMFKRKVGAAVVAARRGGAVNVFNTINLFFFINQMAVPGSCYWNFGVGRVPGDVESDDEGIRTMTVLGENMSWLLSRTADK